VPHRNEKSIAASQRTAGQMANRVLVPLTLAGFAIVVRRDVIEYLHPTAGANCHAGGRGSGRVAHVRISVYY
jgi:hypothetical protein